MHFFCQDDLIYRLTKGLLKREQDVVFLVGSGLSAPLAPGAPGVPSAGDILDLIRQEFAGDHDQLARLNSTLDEANEKRYQAAFLFLQGRLGQTAANEIIQRAVLQARLVPNNVASSMPTPTSDEDLRLLDFDHNWQLNPGTEALGRLVTHYPKNFGRTILTTNFDPLIEVAIHSAGGAFYKTALHADGNLAQTHGQGCHVVHLHGYWYGADTLHTVGQLEHPRPHLRTSLAALLRNKLVVVSGYGGWDDVFGNALFEVVCDDSATPEILWAFYESPPEPSERLLDRLSAGISRGRVSLYAGTDCNFLLPKIYGFWSASEKRAPTTTPAPTNQVRVSDALRLQMETASQRQTTVQGDDEDRPPVVDVCVGRERELQQIKESTARVVFVTGIGGQGKSTLVAQYFAYAQQERLYNYYVWRDCKEEGERFENQLASVIETLSGGKIAGQDLSKQDINSIVQLFIALTARTSVLLIFDNTDHYVNLEENKMTSSADILIGELLSSTSPSRIVLTCRPSVSYRNANSLSCHLEGISLEATRALFGAREAACTDEEIADAHTATKGHAFWLDLLSIQIAKQSSLSLRRLLEKLQAEQGFLPEKTLTSIWQTLSEKEQLVLRSMAEAVRPETESEIADLLHSELNYRKVMKALNALKSMNLVVVKRMPTADDVFELHPLVRQFIRQRFSKGERYSFIDEIIKTYRRFMSSHRFLLSERPPFTTLQYWTHTAELDLAAGRIGDAVLTLAEAAGSFASSGYAREFCRTARRVLDSVDWANDYGKYKGLDSLFATHVHNLCHLGEWPEVDHLMDKFEVSVAERDTRYIQYCSLKCFSKWTRGEFSDAVMWGKKGQSLKRSSDVDTEYDASHNLALAERDAGQPELALPVFLAGRTLGEVLEPDELDEKRGGPHYGNIGRCLHFMGQIDSALICYQKSALLVEKDFQHERIINQGYIRKWIGEVLLAREHALLAATFFESAKLKWEQVSPPKATQIRDLQRQLGSQLPDRSTLSKEEIDRTCLDWISGRLSDA